MKIDRIHTDSKRGGKQPSHAWNTIQSVRVENKQVFGAFLSHRRGVTRAKHAVTGNKLVLIILSYRNHECVSGGLQVIFDGFVRQIRRIFRSKSAFLYKVANDSIRIFTPGKWPHRFNRDDPAACGVLHAAWISEYSTNQEVRTKWQEK